MRKDLFQNYFKTQTYKKGKNFITTPPQDYKDYYDVGSWGEHAHVTKSYSGMGGYKEKAYRRMKAKDQISWLINNGGWDIKSLLEVGCGTGNFLYVAKRKGKQVTGVEPHPESNIISIWITKEKINEKLGQVEGKHDLVFLSHVLEHFKEPEKEMPKIKEFCGKLIFVEVPCCDNPRVLRHSIEKNPHITHFTEEGLKEFVEDQGFKVIITETMRTLGKGFDAWMNFYLKNKPMYVNEEAEHAEVIRVLARV
jgi:SAM-dependent methyltransferase|tara:strand:+ start:12997 stop:13752 length:756 start_codon:yes stop_codon:yes gene_type:complete